VTAGPSCVLTINCGSSSIRFAVYEVGETTRRRLNGKIDRIGLGGTHLIVEDPPRARGHRRVALSSHRTAVEFLQDWLHDQPIFASVRAIGHRVVHGMDHREPERVTPKLVAKLRRFTAFAPDHLPREIEMIEAFARRYPRLPQVVCFDTAFHRTMPQVAKLLAIPRRYQAKGVERYGFHGLSYTYLIEELGRLDPAAAKGRVILAHLGSGASLAAVHRGRSLDTSMGFTPAAGLVMSTRSGDLDPGLVYYLARTEQITAARFQRMVNHESGLLGVSATSSDLRDLCARRGTDVRAAEAVDLFCYQIKKWIGAFAAALGGLDTLVFAAGIGENAPQIRERICEGLGFLGVKLHKKRNAKNEPLISMDTGRVKVRVIRTDEELMIARSVVRVLNLRTIGKVSP
jgi:acetate kinase